MADQQQTVECAPLPEEFASLVEAAAFWDTHSSKASQRKR
jgi:hypothetical protein